MIIVKEAEDCYEITFRYDVAVIEHIKNIPGRAWVPEKKLWQIPKARLGWLIKEFEGTDYESSIQIFSNEQININQSLDKTTYIPNIDISDVNFRVKEGAKPYQHQLDYMKYVIDRWNKGLRSGFVLADEPGLGKSLEVCNDALYRREHGYFNHCLVICCVNSSKYNWKNDIFQHTKGAEEPYILGSRRKRDGGVNCNGGGKEKYEDLHTGHMYGDTSAPELPYFLILNVEALRYHVGKSYPITEEVINWCKLGRINMIAIDEVHKNTSPSSQQGKQIIAIKHQTGSKIYWIPMTGTPITNKPTDVFLPLKLIDGHTVNSYYMWCQKFCVYGGFGEHEIVGYKNINLLKDMLQGNMLRRLKADVLDLPEKIRMVDYVENTQYQQRLYQRVSAELIQEASDSIYDTVNPMTKLLRLRQVNGSPELLDDKLVIDNDYLKKNAKFTRVMELLEEIHDRGEKVIIFSNWVEPLRTLYKFVSTKYKTCCFTGTMSSEAREKHKLVFQTNPAYTVLLGTIGAAGTTHTFTAATNIIYIDEPWTPADKLQSEDRAHRIGTTMPLNIYTIITKDTVDDKVHDILYTKEGVSSYIVDNKLDLTHNPRLYDMLIGKEK